MTANLRDQIEKIESYLLQEYDVEVDYDQENDNAYYEDLQRIEINTRQNFKCRLHTLLHEAGHVVLRNGPDPTEFKNKFPFMRKRGYTVRGSKDHRIDVMREEVLAWEQGRHLAECLNIPLDVPRWNKHRQEALAAYVEWI